MMTIRRILLTATLMLAACGGGSDSDGQSYGLQQRQSPVNLGFPTGVAQPGPINRVRAFPSLSFSRPVKLTHAGDGTDRIFVMEQDGVIRVFDNDDAATTTSEYLDIRSLVSRAGNEEGLLGLAFDPDHASNGHLYVYYSASGPRRSVIARFTAAGGSVDPATRVELLSFTQPYSNHNGGELAFGPDDKLYISSGDGGSGGDPQNNGQTINSFLGKILRMNTDGTAPSDNPFYAGAGEPTDFVWAYGLRNPWRMSFDRETDDLWAGDVGQGEREEIDIIVKGANYGWRIFEGNSEYSNPQNLPASNFAAPVVDYPRSLGASVTGGYVYRGSVNRSLIGTYFYADFVSGRVWALVWAGDRLISNEQVATVNNPSSFGEDEAGELYVCSFDGGIYKFEETGGVGGDTAPALLSQSGLFADLASLAPTAGVIEYEVNAELWVDGASKRRWIAIPGNEQITFHATGAWEFPTGTVVVKHFELEGRRVETRVLVRSLSGWDGYSYKWNDQGTDAELLDDGETEAIPVTGGTQNWTFPSRADCATCHNAAAGFLLAVQANQLNRDFAYAAQTDNQLRAWNHIGLFDTNVGDSAQYAALPDPLGTADLDMRARAYLQANCAGCHLPAGPTAVNIDLRYETAQSAMNLFGVTPSDGSLGLPNERRAVAGNKESSSLWERMRRRDQYGMPPIGSHLVDDAGVALIGAWIDSK
ncbi:MAG: PQQ-dependent sugar dehydrogenase [Planctomycetota bacterium]|jgi:uncharacterized repeat protein (TIGR03806 family)